tara:strand:- start:49 stop:816 length:768 start_codon:yes stop_codon:yes gene_type:complete
MDILTPTINNMDILNVLERLKNDEDYYGDFGKQFLSYSDIKTLLTNPKEFKVSREDNKAFAEGRYFHQCILEPDKAKYFPAIDVASRNTKAYKEAIEESGQTVILLQKEKEGVDEMVKAMKGNFEYFDAIYEDGNKFEVPMVATIKGKPFKGKADIVGKDFLIDLKTSSNIHDFKWTSRKYNYDVQCYIYQQLFGKPMKFYVIDKTTHLLGRCTPPNDFLRSGEAKLIEALAVYDKYFGDKATEDVNDYVLDIEL